LSSEDNLWLITSSSQSSTMDVTFMTEIATRSRLLFAPTDDSF
jgi:hypothetical protein